jgi:hypothetical protein
MVTREKHLLHIYNMAYGKAILPGEGETMTF